MRIAVDVNHPAHVHFFRNFIREMEGRGHDVLVTASEKDVALRLLEEYGLDYVNLGAYGRSLGRKIAGIPRMDLRMYRIIRSFDPDVVLGFGSVRAAHASKLLGKPSIMFDDDEYSFPYYAPFADAVFGFSGFKKTGGKVVKINSYKELAYLHPDYFKPDTAALREMGVSAGEEFALLRFVSWEAFHDVGRGGFTPDLKRKLVETLGEYVTVFISSEGPLPRELERYRLPVGASRIHDVLYHAKLLVCDSQTMTTEAAVLGTPAIRSNSFVGSNDMGNFIELEGRYGLIFNYADPKEAVDKAIELVQTEGLKELWRDRRRRLLEEKVNVTAFMVWLFGRYPDGLELVRRDPSVQYRFR